MKGPITMLKELLDRVFGESLPPASADGDDGGWERKEHNKRLRSQFSGSQAEVIRMADIQSKKRYDAMDTHIDKLNGLAEASRRRKEKRRARKEAVAEMTSKVIEKAGT